MSENIAPVNHVPATQSTLQNVPLAFSAYRGNSILVSGADSEENPLTVTLETSHGSVTLLNANALADVTWDIGDGDSDRVMVFSGTMESINGALQYVVFRPDTGYAGLDASLSITTSTPGSTDTSPSEISTNLIVIAVHAASETEHVFNVMDFGAVGDGIADDAPAIRAAISAARNGSGGTILFPPATYHLQSLDPTSELATHFNLTDAKGLTFSGYGAKLTSELTVNSYLFYLNGAQQVEFEGFSISGKFLRSGSLIFRQSITAFYLESTRNESRDIRISNVKVEDTYGLLISRGEPYGSTRVRNIILDGVTYSRGFYGINFQNNGDNVTVTNLQSHGLIRTYFSYGVDDHHVEYVSYGGDKFTDCLIKAYQRDTTNIYVKARVIGNTSRDAKVTLESQHNPDNQPIPARLVNVRVQIDDTESSGGKSVRFAYFRDTPSPVQTSIVSSDIFDHVAVSGRVRNTTDYAVNQPNSELIDMVGLDVNDSPTGVFLSSNIVPENQAPNITVGSLLTSDPDTWSTFTYSLVSGIGSTDNEMFSVVGGRLVSESVYDYEAKSHYNVRIRSTDQLGLYTEQSLVVSVADVNESPVSISLTTAVVPENQPAETIVGTLSTSDPDHENEFTYRLVPGIGAVDNASFRVVGDQLQALVSMDYESRDSYSIRLRSTDQGGLSTEQLMTIRVSNVNEVSSGIALSSFSFAENQAAHFVVGVLATSDPDSSGIYSYSLVAGTGSTDNARFLISGNTLQTDASFDYEERDSYSVRVRSSDQGGLFIEQAFTITVTDGDDAPTGISLSATSVNEIPIAMMQSMATVPENMSPGTLVVTFSTIDPDVGDVFSYSLVSGTGATDNSSFRISGDRLQTVTALDAEVQDRYSVRVRSTDAAGLFTEQVIAIGVTNGNEAPSTITLSSTSVSESQATGSLVGSLSTIDPDAQETFTYTLATGLGSEDNAGFRIVGNQLQTAVRFNYEAQSRYRIRVRSTDAGELSTERQFTIDVTNANEAPLSVALSSTSVAENQVVGTVVGSLSVVDPDAEDSFTYSLVSGTGAVDNSNFRVVGNQLQTAVVFDAESVNRYSVRVRGTDSGGLFTEQVIAIDVANGNEAPSSITLSYSSVSENQASGTIVGSLSTTDPDARDTFTYTLATGLGSEDNGGFRIVGNQLQTAVRFNYEAQSRYRIRVRSTDAGGLSTEREFTIVITPVNLPSVQFQVASTVASESRTTASVVVVLSAPSTQTVVVPYSWTGGSATRDSDFRLADGVLAFAPGVTSRTLSFSVVNDTMDEDDETVSITLGLPSNAKWGSITKTVYTVVDNDVSPTASFDFRNSSGLVTTTPSVDEGVGTLSVPILLSRPSARAITVNLGAIDGGTAAGGSDYDWPADTTVTFAPGETRKVLSWGIQDDRLDETNETIRLKLISTQATIGKSGTVTARILDNDSAPTVSFTVRDSSADESNALPGTVLVNLSEASGQRVTVRYAVSTTGTTASSKSDYALSSGTLTFLPGETRKAIPLLLKNDFIRERPEQLQVVLSSPTAATLGIIRSHLFTILDDDTI